MAILESLKSNDFQKFKSGEFKVACKSGDFKKYYMISRSLENSDFKETKTWRFREVLGA